MDKLLLTEWKLRALEGNVSRQLKTNAAWYGSRPVRAMTPCGPEKAGPSRNDGGWLQGAGAVDGGRVGVLGEGRGGASPFLRIAAAGGLARQCRIGRAAWPPAMSLRLAAGTSGGVDAGIGRSST